MPHEGQRSIRIIIVRKVVAVVKFNVNVSDGSVGVVEVNAVTFLDELQTLFNPIRIQTLKDMFFSWGESVSVCVCGRPSNRQAVNRRGGGRQAPT